MEPYQIIALASLVTTLTLRQLASFSDFDKKAAIVSLVETLSLPLKHVLSCHHLEK